MPRRIGDASLIAIAPWPLFLTKILWTVAVVLPLVTISAKADDNSKMTELFRGLAAPSFCQAQPRLNCIEALGIVQKGNYQTLKPRQIIPSRNDSEFSTLFSRCDVAPTIHRNDVDWKGVQNDPFRYEVTAGRNSEGQYLAYGPFSIYDVKLAGGKTRRVIEATGYKGVGTPLNDLHTFAMLDPQHPCSPLHFGQYGYYNSDFRLASWGALISLKSEVYVATYQAWGAGKSGQMKFAPIDVVINDRNSVPRSTVVFSAIDPKDK